MRCSMYVFIGIFSVLILTGCNKGKGSVSPDEQSYLLTAKVNDVLWEGEGTAEYLEGNELLIRGYRALQGHDEEIMLYINFNGTGSYTIQPEKSGFSTSIAGDVHTSFYRSSGGTNDQIIIEKNSGIFIEGTFNLAVSNNLETLIFSEGQFTSKIIK